MSGFLRPFLLVAAGVLLCCATPAVRAAGGPPAPKEDPLILDRYTVEADSGDVSTWPEEKPDVFPFERAGVFGELEAETPMDPGHSMVTEELAALPEARQVEFVSISGGSTPRGFTAPRLRNGLTQLGFPEQIVGGRRDLLTGFMAVLYGRTAPGGIINLTSRRPTPKTSWAFETQVATRPSYFVQAERSELLITRKLNGRVLGSWSTMNGPEQFAERDEGIIAASLRYAPDKLTVVLWEFEAARTLAVPSPGIPLTRPEPGGLIGSPSIEHAEFNTNGPHAWARRDSTSTSLWAERQMPGKWSLRGGAQLWSRTQEELRFSTGPYVLSTGKFDGTREPQYNDRDDRTLGAQLEADFPIKGKRINQRWLAGVEGSHAITDRSRRVLPTADRNALPLGVRSLDPADPDYTTPAYSEATYSRVTILRDELADYVGAFVSDRLSWARGRQGATFGLRQDWVRGSVDDELPGAKIPHATAAVKKTTYHTGWVGQFSRDFATFVNHSTAFQPQRRVDARTGRIQGNESTSGVEAGLRWQTPAKTMLGTLAVYRLWNRNITRLNPQYDDPVLDPNHTQPQLVSSGEEQFTGAEGTFRWALSRSLTAEVRGAWLEAITTSSPDLPQEVGRQLPRTPEFTASASATWRPGPSGLGWSFGAAYAWIGSHVAVYPGTTRSWWRCDAYGVLGLNAGYTWQYAKLRHNAGLSLRNALDEDLIALAGRLGGERTAEARYSVRF